MKKLNFLLMLVIAVISASTAMADDTSTTLTAGKQPLPNDTIFRISPASIALSLGQTDFTSSWTTSVLGSVDSREFLKIGDGVETKGSGDSYFVFTVNQKRTGMADKLVKVELWQRVTLNDVGEWQVSLVEDGNSHTSLFKPTGIPQKIRLDSNKGCNELSYFWRTSKDGKRRVSPFQAVYRIKDEDGYYTKTYAEEYLRLSQYMNTMMSVASIDCTGDGIDEILVAAGHNLYIIDGTTYKLLKTDNVLSGRTCGNTNMDIYCPSLITGDFDGDGTEDIMEFLLGANSLKRDHPVPIHCDIIFYPGTARTGGLDVSQRKVHHQSDYGEWQSALYSKDKSDCRPAITAVPFYYATKGSVPAIALAERNIFYTGTSGRDGWDDSKDFSCGEQLNIFRINSSELSKNDGNWLTLLVDTTRICYAITGSGSVYNTYCETLGNYFSRPSLASAMTNGVDKPATLLWNGCLMSLESTINGSGSSATVVSKLKREGSLFRGYNDEPGMYAMTPVVATIKNADGTYPLNGAEHYIQPWSHSVTKYLQDDFDLGICAFWDDKMYIYDIKCDSTFQYGRQLLDDEEHDDLVLCHSNTFALTPLNENGGIHVKFNSTTGREMMYMSPVVQAVLVTPPYIENWNSGKPSTKFTVTTSSTEADSKTKTTTATFGGGIDAKATSFLVSSVNLAVTKGNTSSASKSITTESSVDYSSDKSIVVYQYLPVYRYTYTVSIPDYPGCSNVNMYFYEAYQQIQTASKTVADFNGNVADPNGIPRITIGSTDGDPGTYRQIAQLDATASDIKAAFGNPEFALLSNSQLFQSVSAGVSTNTTLKMSQAKTEGTSSSSGISVNQTTKLGTALTAVLSFGVGSTSTWGISTTFGSGTWFGGQTPGLISKAGYENYSYEYGQILYKKTVRSKKVGGVWVEDTDTTNNTCDNNHYVQQYLVNDWYVCNYKAPEAEKVAGDVNVDGNVNMADVCTLLSKLIGNTPSTFSFVNADMNSDGVLNTTDLNMIISLILGK